MRWYTHTGWGWLVLGLAGCAAGEPTSFSDGALTFGGTETNPTTTDPMTNPDTGPGSDDETTEDSGMTTLPPEETGCVPEPEVCNGVDDDCNGEIDESDPMIGEACDTGLPGECANGTNICEDGALVCNLEVGAQPETCNGLDDDCDGTVDNDNPEGGGACSTGMLGPCDAGTETCTMGMLECVPDQTPAPMDTCGNGVDDDCNGSVDDGCFTCYDTDLGNSVPQSVGGSNVGQDDTFLSGCGGGADTLYRFEAPAAGTYTFDTIGSAYDTLLTAYSDCMGTEITCNDDFFGNPNCGGYPCAEVSVTLGVGQAVIIAVEGFAGGTGAFTLNISN